MSTIISDEQHVGGREGDDLFYTVAQVAERLQISVPTVWRWIAAGRLRAYRIGPKTVRVRACDLPGWRPSGSSPLVPAYYTVEQLARRLQVAHPTVWRWIEEGLLPAERLSPKIIRIRPEAVGPLICPVQETPPAP